MNRLSFFLLNALRFLFNTNSKRHSRHFKLAVVLLDLIPRAVFTSQNKTVGVLNIAVQWTAINELQPCHYINFVIWTIFVHDSEIGPLWIPFKYGVWYSRQNTSQILRPIHQDQLHDSKSTYDVAMTWTDFFQCQSISDQYIK